MQIDPRLPAITDCLYRVSAKAIIIKDHKILLVREKETWWGLPGGGIDYGETAAQALVRELGEELGVSATSIRVGDQAALFSAGAIVDSVPRANVYYQAETLTDTFAPTNEVSGCEWFAAADLASLYLGPSTKNILAQLQALLA